MAYGLFIDLRAIQDYIFASNRLKDNIGASYLIKHLLEEFLTDQGYCGGGNLFLLCKDEKEAKETIYSLSRKILNECPGLSFSAVYEENFNLNDFPAAFSLLQEKLRKEKEHRIQQTTVPSFGINAQCNYSGYAAVEIDHSREDELLSEIVYAKRIASKKAEEETKQLYAAELSDSYIFPEKFDDLGIDKGNESYLAVVHIDGNGIGKLFAEQKDLDSTIKLSNKIDELCLKAFKAIVSKTVEKCNKSKKKENALNDTSSIGGKYLPLRPLFIGGDDITFVCKGRLGIPLAIEFIKQIKEDSDDLLLSFCAGIAVANYKYPFYQVYQMASSLCRSAKNKRLTNNNNDSYLDFHLINASVYDPLDEIRSKNYILPQEKSLTRRPYSLSELEQLLNATYDMYSKWPNSKIKELRSALYKSEHQLIALLKQITSREDLPIKFTGFEDYSDTLFFNNQTIYLDMIELMEMIPLEENNDLQDNFKNPLRYADWFW